MLHANDSWIDHFQTKIAGYEAWPSTSAQVLQSNKSLLLSTNLTCLGFAKMLHKLMRLVISATLVICSCHRREVLVKYAIYAYLFHYFFLFIPFLLVLWLPPLGILCFLRVTIIRIHAFQLSATVGEAHFVNCLKGESVILLKLWSRKFAA